MNGRHFWRSGAMLSAVLLLSACATTSPWRVPYSIVPASATGPSAASTLQGRTAAAILPVLRLAPVTAPEWLQGHDFHYRLLYENPQQALYYRDARWVGTPAQMMGDLLQGQLMDGGQWQAVLAPTSTGKAKLLLQVRLNDFTLDFSAPRQGVAQVAGEATLVDAQNYRVLGQQRFAFRAPTIPANPDGGALAMTRAGRAFAKAVSQWAERVARHSMPG